MFFAQNLHICKKSSIFAPKLDRYTMRKFYSLIILLALSLSLWAWNSPVPIPNADYAEQLLVYDSGAYAYHINTGDYYNYNKRNNLY